MAWQIEYLSGTRRQLKKLDLQVSRQIVAYMADRVIASGDPYLLGKALTGTWAGHWRYRVGDYRVICRLLNRKMVVMVVRAGHRSSVYDQPLTLLESEWEDRE